MGRYEKERWVPIDIDGIERGRYFISTWGRIQTKDGKILKYYKDKDGYLKCTLYTKNKKRKHFMVHRLVAIHFIPNPDNKPQVNHLRPKEKDKLYYKYFEWVTQKENRQDAINKKLQTTLTCAAHGMATLTLEEAHRICKMMEDGYSNNEICKAFGYTNDNKKEKERFRSVIKHIRSRKTWIPASRNYKF